jgi:hypothetical protein
VRAFSGKYVIIKSRLLYTFAQAAFTHTAGTRAHRLFLSAFVRANDVQEEEHSSSLSFFLSFFTHTRACINSSQ